MRNPSRSRTSFFAASMGSVAAVVFARFRGDAAEFNLKLANGETDNHPVNLRFKPMAERVRNETNGRLTISVFPNNVLGRDSQMITQLRLGAIDIYIGGDNVIANVVPVASISNVGFAFEDIKQVFTTMDGPLGAHVREQIQKVELYAFRRMLDNGFRQITTGAAPVTQAADLVGLKIRVPNSPIGTAVFKALGASPAPLDISEVYTALQTRIVDGQENPLSMIEAFHFYEVQKYCSLSAHMWAGMWVVMNEKSRAGLPKALFDTLERNVNEAALLDRLDIDALNASLQPKLAQQGMAFNQVNRASFQAKLRQAGFYDAQRRAFGETAWSLLEKSVGKLA